MSAPSPETPATVLFDGQCGLCNRAVWFIIARDAERRFRFAPLESTYAHECMRARGIDPEQRDSVVMVDGERAWVKSAALLRIAGRLSFPWPLAWVFVVVPRFLRDAVYDWIAHHRHRWFGCQDSCRVPGPDEADRFRD